MSGVSMEELRSSYVVLGLDTSASKDQVKEAFRRLCLTHHPDKCSPDLRATAESRFKEIKGAYDNILKGQAGYAPPPPGSRGGAFYARAYARAHPSESAGPVRTGGPYGGFSREWDFYRSMFRTTRNNPFVLIVTGLVCIPAVSAFVSVFNGNTGWIERFKNEGVYMFKDSRYKINGRSSVINPWSIGDLSNERESYIYKHPKFQHLRKQSVVEELQARQEQAGFAASAVQ